MAEKVYTLQELKDIMQIVQKNDPASLVLTAPTLNGPFSGNPNQQGLFSAPGVRPERFSAQVQPNSILSLLRPEKSEYVNELIEIQTGQTASSTTNATGWCGNPPSVGQLKVMQRIFRFGRFLVKTDLNAIPDIGRLRDRADLPGEILNYAMQQNPYLPDGAARIVDSRDQLRYEMYRIGNQFAIDTEKVLWNGTFTGTTQNNFTGWFNEFAGLAGQVRTGYTDAVSGLLAPAADSDVTTFGAAIDGTSPTTSLNIVETLTNSWYSVTTRAKQVGMEGTVFAIFMGQEMFRALTEVWACTYATYRCRTGNDAGNPVERYGMEIQALRTEMLNGRYLLIDGIQVPVQFSDGINLTRTGSNTFIADIFILPLEWNARPLVRLQYFAMDNTYANEFANAFGLERNPVTMNNGLWMVGKRDTGLCVEYHFATQWRVWLETPFLAARVDNISFSYFAKTRRADPAQTSFYADGGRTYS